jgi:hypothetical protein
MYRARTSAAANDRLLVDEWFWSTGRANWYVAPDAPTLASTAHLWAARLEGGVPRIDRAFLARSADTAAAQ